ncbi:recombinase family protein [Streptomyces sp. NPDC087263]|uniref:recombinase family protein n=1 Tax=Streptomyces sp. NPDC087263 TaxID=3365773 RepID=UPI0037F3B9C3
MQAQARTSAGRQCRLPRRTACARRGVGRPQANAAWNRNGITTSKGNPWTWIALRDMMRNPRLCGYRSHVVIEFDPESGREIRNLRIAHDDEGEPVRGQWTPILEVSEWEAIQEIIGDGPMRGGGHNARVYLSTGILRCGREDAVARPRQIRTLRNMVLR